ncbi:hypothetical protein GWK36_02675 [Caldichromatium japonicum]|uniref:Uncharacterized protein n=1 Tax=Caldichromatium japonicum TaxID=2699430 RepID=A0A6G7VBB7_9GAMM|nr:hypothetical protein [Caldichromatium japonicum]QIK37087.1 hypothetical protein GWK36_02675 [Caldichromatium japonicum]
MPKVPVWIDAVGKAPASMTEGALAALGDACWGLLVILNQVNQAMVQAR